MTNSFLKILHYIAIIFLFGKSQICASSPFEYYMSVDCLRPDYEPWRAVGSKVPWPKEKCSTIIDVPVSPARNSIVQIKGSPASVAKFSMSPERPDQTVEELPPVFPILHQVTRIAGCSKSLALVEEEASDCSDSGDLVSVTSAHDDVQQSLVQLDVSQPESSPDEVIFFHHLTDCPPNTFEVKFLYSDFGNLDTNSDRASGYVPLILYKLTINEDNGINDLVTITRLTDKKGVHLFKISPNPYVDELTQADRVFSLAGRGIDFLLRNGNELYWLYERGISEDICASELQPIVETIVKYFKAQSLPAYRKLNVPEVKKLFPSEKKTMGNTYFSLQPPQGESFVVRTRQGQCWLMTQLLSLSQSQAFDAFKELYGDCPIGLVTTRDDQNFSKNADKFKF